MVRLAKSCFVLQKFQCQHNKRFRWRRTGTTTTKTERQGNRFVGLCCREIPDDKTVRWNRTRQREITTLILYKRLRALFAWASKEIRICFGCPFLPVSNWIVGPVWQKAKAQNDLNREKCVPVKINSTCFTCKPTAYYVHQARRRTGTQEEFLYPDRIKTRRDPRLDPAEDEKEATALVPSLPLVPALPCPTEPKGTRQISPELMQKLLELEKSRKGQNSETLMPPPPAAQGNQSESQGGPVKTSRSNSLNGNSTAPVPASLVRGNIKSKSARSFPVSKFGSSGSANAIHPRSQPSSPALQRKSLPDRPGAG